MCARHRTIAIPTPDYSPITPGRANKLKPEVNKDSLIVRETLALHTRDKDTVTIPILRRAQKAPMTWRPHEGDEKDP